MSTLVDVQDVVKLHGKGASQLPVLRGVTLAIEEGSFVCVMGPSGSGKTTLLHLISGLDSPSAGRIVLAGHDLATLSLGARTLLRRRTIGYVFQFFNLLPSLSLRENVALPLAIAGAARTEEERVVGPLLERFGIASRAQARPHELSGGEMQRTSIARALAGGQPLILADEPTGNLSQKAGLEVMHALREVCDRDRRTVLLVTHNPRDAACADRVHFLVDGALDPDHVLHGPSIRVEAVHEALLALEI